MNLWRRRPIAGLVNLSFGNHSIFVRTGRPVNQIWLYVHPQGNQVCQASPTLCGAIPSCSQGEHGFNLFAEVRSDSATIYYECF
jgi:hypothetical protein